MIDSPPVGTSVSSASGRPRIQAKVAPPPPAFGAQASSGRGKRCALALLLAFLVIAVFANITRNGFIFFDDDKYILDNYHVRTGLTLENIRWAFTTTFSANWHPLTWISHLADVQLFGLDPRGHHLVSLLWHAVNSGILFLVLAGLTGATWPAFFAASLFGLHPLHVESVVWAAERKDVLSTFFWILSLACYVRWLRRPGWRGLTVLGTCMAVGLMAKPMLVTLPFVLLLLDWWPLGRLAVPGSGGPGLISLGRALREKLPLLILSVASGMVTFVAQSRGGSVGSLTLLPLWLRIGNGILSYGRYLLKTVWPARLGVFYTHPMFDLPGGQTVVWGLILALLTFLVAMAARRMPYLATGWFWYLGTLVPVIGLVQVGAQGMADRYTYVPLIGLFIILAWGAQGLRRRFRPARRVIPAAAVAALIVLGMLTRIQVGYWKDTYTLFEHTILVTRDNYFALLNLGIVYGKSGDYLRAEDAYRKALRIAPDWEEAHYQLGLVLVSAGDLDGAAREQRILSDLNPPKAARLQRFIEVARGGGP